MIHLSIVGVSIEIINRDTPTMLSFRDSQGRERSVVIRKDGSLGIEIP